MKILLNGDDYEAGDDATVQDVLEAVDLAGGRVAVLLNDEVVRRGAFSETRLEPGFRMEVIQMVGGG